MLKLCPFLVNAIASSVTAKVSSKVHFVPPAFSIRTLLTLNWLISQNEMKKKKTKPWKAVMRLLLE